MIEFERQPERSVGFSGQFRDGNVIADNARSRDVSGQAGLQVPQPTPQMRGAPGAHVLSPELNSPFQINRADPRLITPSSGSHLHPPHSGSSLDALFFSPNETLAARQPFMPLLPQQLSACQQQQLVQQQQLYLLQQRQRQQQQQQQQQLLFHTLPPELQIVPETQQDVSALNDQENSQQIGGDSQLQLVTQKRGRPAVVQPVPAGSRDGKRRRGAAAASTDTNTDAVAAKDKQAPRPRQKNFTEFETITVCACSSRQHLSSS